MKTNRIPKKDDIIAGKFQVEDVLGAGGMGVVIAARHLVLRRRVAVKFLLPQAARLPEASARFVREARAAVAIQSEHVARVLDVDVLDNGAPYMVMEFLSGTDFACVLKQRGALPIPDAIDFLLQACEAIAEAHALGIVHRDLKPGNLFLTKHAEGSPLVKVLDFGLSRMTVQDDTARDSSLTATGVIAGSPFYMSPEQLRSLKHVDWRTDIWALGTILYEMLAGRRAFDAPTLTAVCASVAADTPPSLRTLRPEVPEALEAAVMACLEKDPMRRMRSVAELALAIAPFAPAGSIASVEKIVRLLPGTKTEPLVPDPEVATLVLPSSESVGPTGTAAQETAKFEPNGPAQAESQALAPATMEPATTGPAEVVARRRPPLWLGVMAVVSLSVAVVGWMSRGSGREPAGPTSTSAMAASSPTSAPPAPRVSAEVSASPMASPSGAPNAAAASTLGPVIVAPRLESPPVKPAPMATLKRLPEKPSAPKSEPPKQKSASPSPWD